MTYKRQFIHAFREDIAKANMPAQHKLLLFTLTLYANSEGGNIYPAQETLAEACCCTRRTIIRQLKHLQTAGWVALVRRGGTVDGDRAARATNRYQLQVGMEFTVKGDDVYVKGEEPPAATTKPAQATKTAKVVKLPVLRAKRAAGHDTDADFEPDFEDTFRPDFEPNFPSSFDIDAAMGYESDDPNDF